MLIEMLICDEDGQRLEQREVPDAWFETAQPDDSAETAK